MLATDFVLAAGGALFSLLSRTHCIWQATFAENAKRVEIHFKKAEASKVFGNKRTISGEFSVCKKDVILNTNQKIQNSLLGFNHSRWNLKFITKVKWISTFIIDHYYSTTLHQANCSFLQNNHQAKKIKFPKTYLIIHRITIFKISFKFLLTRFFIFVSLRTMLLFVIAAKKNIKKL